VDKSFSAASKFTHVKSIAGDPTLQKELVHAFQKSGSLPFPILMSDGSTRNSSFTLTLKKDSAGRRQLEIER